MLRQADRPPVFTAMLALFVLGGLAGCRNTREGLEKDSAENVQKAREGAKELKEEAKHGAEKAAEATAVVIDDAGRQATAAGRTLAVKTALMADKRVDASHVDVDSDGGAMIVHLRGSVSTLPERVAAEEIAREQADGWKISNELVVGAKSD